MKRRGGDINIDDYDFKGVYIPKEIWLSRDMTGMEKLVFVEIHALDRKFGCVADNKHFAAMFGVTERTIQNHIKSLKDKGLIKVENNKVDDTRVMRVIGKFARVSEEEIARQDFLIKELARNFKA